jgi:hypothetical protein
VWGTLSGLNLFPYHENIGFRLRCGPNTYLMSRLYGLSAGMRVSQTDRFLAQRRGCWFSGQRCYHFAAAAMVMRKYWGKQGAQYLILKAKWQHLQSNKPEFTCIDHFYPRVSPHIVNANQDLCILPSVWERHPGHTARKPP